MYNIHVEGEYSMAWNCHGKPVTVRQLRIAKLRKGRAMRRHEWARMFAEASWLKYCPPLPTGISSKPIAIILSLALVLLGWFLKSPVIVLGGFCLAVSVVEFFRNKRRYGKALLEARERFRQEEPRKYKLFFD